MKHAHNHRIIIVSNHSHSHNVANVQYSSARFVFVASGQNTESNAPVAREELDANTHTKAHPRMATPFSNSIIASMPCDRVGIGSIQCLCACAVRRSRDETIFLLIILKYLRLLCYLPHPILHAYLVCVCVCVKVHETRQQQKNEKTNKKKRCAVSSD